MTIVCLAFTFFAMLHIHTSLQINTFSALYKSAFSVEIAFHSFKFTTVFTNYYDRTRVEQKNTTAKTYNWKFHRSSILGSVKQVLLKRLKKEIRGKFFYNTNEKKERERYELVWNETSRTWTIKTWMRAWAKRYINTSIIHTHPHPNAYTHVIRNEDTVQHVSSHNIAHVVVLTCTVVQYIINGLLLLLLLLLICVDNKVYSIE